MRILDFSDGFSSASAPSAVSLTAFTFLNNQSTASVTGALVSSTISISAKFELYVIRYTTTSYRFARVVVETLYDPFNSIWSLVDYVEKGSSNLTGEPSGITWSMTAAGQLQYATDNMGGSSYLGASKFLITAISV